MSENRTRYVILGLLTEENLTGYELKKIIELRFSFFWSESYGQLYPAFKALTEEGLVTAKNQEGESRRAKTVYSITEKGREALAGWLREPSCKESVRLEILLKLYFSRYGDVNAVTEQLEAFFAEHQRQLYMLNLFETELSGIEEEHANHRDILRVIDCGQKVNRAYLDWCSETIAYLKGRDSHEAEN